MGLGRQKYLEPVRPGTPVRLGTVVGFILRLLTAATRDSKVTYMVSLVARNERGLI